MHKLEELKEMLTRELESYSTKTKLDASTLDVVDKLTHTIKNLDKIFEDDGYSGRNYRRDSMGRYVGNYDYSMDDRMYDNGYSMRYSRDAQSIKNELKDIMNDVGETTRQKLQRIVSQM
jgi:hypothetical protein